MSSGNCNAPLMITNISGTKLQLFNTNFLLVLFFNLATKLLQTENKYCPKRYREVHVRRKHTAIKEIQRREANVIKKYMIKKEDEMDMW